MITLNQVFVKNYDNREETLKINEKEALRYSGFTGDFSLCEEEIKADFYKAEEELEKNFTPKVCFAFYDLKREGEKIILPFECLSKDLNLCLKDSESILIFAATLGIKTDLYIKKNMISNKTRALYAEGIGSEKAERLCDFFCSEIKEEIGGEAYITPRFSPGYGDFKLEHQRDIFKLLEPEKNIGVSLTKGLLMSPCKSVTAVMGIKS